MYETRILLNYRACIREKDDACESPYSRSRQGNAVIPVGNRRRTGRAIESPEIGEESCSPNKVNSPFLLAFPSFPPPTLFLTTFLLLLLLSIGTRARGVRARKIGRGTLRLRLCRHRPLINLIYIGLVIARTRNARTTEPAHTDSLTP